jgi:hypothetical protein
VENSSLKSSSLSLPACAVALLTAILFAASTIAQAPQTTPPPAGAQPPARHEGHSHQAPTNLQVLPKTLSGEDVHDIMEQWAGGLGVHCDACHKPDPNNIAPNGRPRLNFADDSKPEKLTARKMFTMTEEINRNYVSKIDSSGAPVTCGTCHRGHLGPQPFVIPDDDDAPRPPQAPPPAAAPQPESR